MNILVVEDETTLNDAIVTYLEREGYTCDAATDYAKAKQAVQSRAYTCAIVDLSLPGGNGLDIVQSLKTSQPDAGIIIISAKNAVDDKIKGLDIGADDYLTKPFHLSELNARIKSVLRRRGGADQNLLQVGDIAIKPEAAEVWVKGEAVSLTKKEFDLLLYFVSNRGRVLAKESIAEYLWGDEIDLFDSLDFVYTHIKNLRKKLQAVGGQDYIRTVYGMGYKFTGS